MFYFVVKFGKENPELEKFENENDVAAAMRGNTYIF
jgi:hypothetical protein